MATAAQRILLVGLGNLPLPRTRHSIGHHILDSLAERLGYKYELNERYDGYLAEGETTLNDKPAQLYLFKPRPLMNVLGHAVSKTCRNTVGNPSSVIVIHDTMKLESTRLKVKFGGEPDGHRGIRSCNKFLHTADYFRIQVGIGRAGTAKEYVLGPLNAFERKHFSVNGEGTDEVWSCIEEVARKMERGIRSNGKFVAQRGDED